MSKQVVINIVKPDNIIVTTTTPKPISQKVVIYINGTDLIPEFPDEPFEPSYIYEYLLLEEIGYLLQDSNEYSRIIINEIKN